MQEWGVLVKHTPADQRHRLKSTQTYPKVADVNQQYNITKTIHIPSK